MPSLRKQKSAPEFKVFGIGPITQQQTLSGTHGSFVTPVYHGSEQIERNSDRIKVRQLGLTSENNDCKLFSGNSGKCPSSCLHEDNQGACTDDVPDARENLFYLQKILSQNIWSKGHLNRTSDMPKPISPLRVRCQSESRPVYDNVGMRAVPWELGDKPPIQKRSKEDTLPHAGSVPLCYSSQYFQRVMSSPSIGPKFSTFVESSKRQPNNRQGVFQRLAFSPRCLQDQQSLSRTCSSQLGLTADTIPEFVIPPTLKRSSTLSRNVSKITVPESNEFMCKVLHRPRSEVFPASVSSYDSMSNTSVDRQFFDPGLPRGLTLKHIEISTTNYGFPMLSEPARWATDESIFHSSSHSRSTLSEQNSTSSNCEKTKDSKFSRSESSASCDEPSDGTNRNKSAESTFEKQVEIESQDYRRSPYVYSCNKSIVIANVKQPLVEFSGELNSTTKTVNVTLHSVYLPGMDIERLETRVFVWMGKHHHKCRSSRQKTKWMSEDSTDRYLFGTEMNFRYHDDISLYWLTFKVVTRRVDNKDIYHRAGKVMLPVGSRGAAFCHITRILEATYQVNQAIIKVP